MDATMISSEPPKDGPARPKAKGLTASLIVLGVVLVGLAWFIHSLANTLHHIMPGYSGGISTSMEPRDYVFRRMPDGSKSEESERQPLEWHLRLPRAFVTDENGKSGVVNKGALRGGDAFFLTAQMLVSPDGKTFVPTAGQPPERQMERSLVVHLSNESAIQSIRKFAGSCVPQNQMGTILSSRGDNVWRDIPCYDQELRCSVWMDVDGWRIQFAATKDLYANPDHACGLVREFLNSHTSKRDRIP
jgi:hypothetical protein